MSELFKTVQSVWSQEKVGHLKPVSGDLHQLKVCDWMIVKDHWGRHRLRWFPTAFRVSKRNSWIHCLYCRRVNPPDLTPGIPLTQAEEVDSPREADRGPEM